MAVSKKEQILDAFVSLLKTIRKSNGFSFDVKKVVRAPLIMSFTSDDAPIIFVEALKERYEGLPSRRARATLSVSIAGGLVPDTETLEDLGQLATDLNQFEYDVRRILGTDTGTILSGIVDMVMIRESATDLGYALPGRGLFALDLEVTYGFSLSDPS